MTMHIGGIYGGPDVTGSRIDLAIERIIKLRGEGRVEASASLDIVFHVAGLLVAPDYQGVRTGSLSKKKRVLQVQVAVPREINTREQVEVEHFVLTSLRQAIRVARPVFEKARIPYRQDEYERLVERIEKALSPN